MKPLALCIALFSAAGLAACQGCQTLPSAAVADEEPKTTQIRLYLISTVAGALEPCGCTKDQLGGFDHLAAFLEEDRKKYPNTMVLGAGPLLFDDPVIKGEITQQASWNADAIALSAKEIGLLAWAPGANDWAVGQEALLSYKEKSGSALLAANLKGVQGAAQVILRDVAGIKIGLVGVADPKRKGADYPSGVTAEAALSAMKSGVDSLKAQGANILIGLAAIPRGEALRLADGLPELNVLLVGKPMESGHANDVAKPPVLAGSTLVVEAANHLQSIAAVDLVVRGNPKGLVHFKDGGDIARGEEVLSLATRIRTLEIGLQQWEGNKNIKPEDIAARKADLEKLRAEKAKMEADDAAAASAKGNAKAEHLMHYTLVEVREKYGSEKKVAEQMLAYYKRVNEYNKVTFADRKPEPVEKGKAAYIGVDACTDCHDEERRVWDEHGHAKAYKTLQKDFKEFNLDCVSCHVTGYGKPGGSTVTFVDKLMGVQCEECHGPGSLHKKDPKKKDLIQLKPDEQMCVSACHHPPHVEGFDPKEKMKLVLGPGHGMD